VKRLGVVLLCLVIVAVAAVPGGSAASQSAAEARQAGSPSDGSVSWLALGDSYSSGEGISNLPASDECQRADGKDGRGRAWAAVAQQELSARGLAFPADQFQLTACTGAVSGGLTSGIDDPAVPSNWEEQFADAGSRPADLVTFSFGGNNVGFATVIGECVGVGALDALLWDQVRSCTAGEPQLADAVNTWASKRDSTDFGLPLPLLLEQVASRAVNPGGKIVVVGYPQLFEESGRWGVWNGNHCARVRAKDADTIRGLVSLMNQRLKEGAEAVSGRTNRVEIAYVDAASVYESSAGRHGLCTGEPWINGLSPVPRYQRSFHPNQAGHEALGRAVADRIAQLDFSTVAPGPNTKCGAVQTEDGPLETRIAEGHEFCDVVLSTLGGLVGTPPAADLVEAGDSEWTLGRWSCRYDTLPNSAIVYSCRSNGTRIETIPVEPEPDPEPPPATHSEGPVLGFNWGQGSEGFGVARPTRVFLGGDPTGLVDDITWESWGGGTATGHGTASYLAPDAPTVADSTREPATIVVFDLGRCMESPAPAYTAVTWYFPTKGEQLDRTRYTYACRGDYVDQNEAGD